MKQNTAVVRVTLEIGHGKGQTFSCSFTGECDLAVNLICGKHPSHVARRLHQRVFDALSLQFYKDPAVEKRAWQIVDQLEKLEDRKGYVDPNWDQLFSKKLPEAVKALEDHFAWVQKVLNGLKADDTGHGGHSVSE